MKEGKETFDAQAIYESLPNSGTVGDLVTRIVQKFPNPSADVTGVAPLHTKGEMTLGYEESGRAHVGAAVQYSAEDKRLNFVPDPRSGEKTRRWLEPELPIRWKGGSGLANL